MARGRRRVSSSDDEYDGGNNTTTTSTSRSQRRQRTSSQNSQQSTMDDQSHASNSSSNLEQATRYFHTDVNFPDGSITKIVYHNFLTYDNAVLTPGPNLNVIIGTNGSGKSTVICGICLAVGGSPKVLGRSEKYADYIKHGQEKGFVEVHIRDESKGDQVCRVELYKPNNADYFINGQKKTQSKVRELVASYNIQIDNPCTFLAQDKVKSFAEQSPQELLKNTQRAGNEALLAQHEALLKRKLDEGELDDRLHNTSSRVNAINAELPSLQLRVDNFRKKESLQTRVRLLDKKKSMLLFDGMQGRVDTAKQEAINKKKLHDKTQCEVDRVGRVVDEAKAKQADIRNHMDKMSNEIRGVEQRVSLAIDPNFYKQKVADSESQLEVTRKRAEAWERDKNKIRGDIAVNADQLEKLKEEPTDDQLREAQCALQEVIDKSNEMRADSRRQVDIANEEERLCRKEESELRQAERESRQHMEEKFHMMGRLGRGGQQDAWKWYQNNRDKFQHPVYVPILHLSLKRGCPELAIKALETAIGYRDVCMFIFGSKDDEMLLSNSRQPWKLATTVVSPQQVRRSELSPCLSDEFRRLGFEGLASDFVEAPLPLMHFAIAAGLGRIPLCSRRMSSAQEADLMNRVQNMNQNQYGRFFIGDKIMNVKVSRYTGQTSTVTDTVAPHVKFFDRHEQRDERFDRDRMQQRMEELREALDGIREKRDKAQKQTTGMMDEINRARAAVTEVTNKKQKIISLEGVLNTMRQRLRDKEREAAPDVAEAERAAAEAKENALREVERRADEAIAGIEKMHTLCMRSVALSLTESAAAAESHEAQTRLADLRDKHEHAKNELRDAKTMYDERVSQLQQAKQGLLKHCGLPHLDPAQLSPPQKKILEGLIDVFREEKIPDDLDSVEQEYEQEKARLNIANKDGDQNDVAKLDRLLEERDDLLRRQTDQQTAKQNWKDDMMQAVLAWRTPLQALIARISHNYSIFFSQIKCTGEVHLDIPDDELEISAYGMKIMVRFREGERLRRLDHQVQSGGERSVSTMLYLLALQELCPVPFRCVDEINQGMDPTNERKVFEIMVDQLSGHGNLAKTQYFLLTPKLLHDLKFNEKVAVQIVHNGPTMCNGGSRWNPGAALDRMRTVR